MGLFFYNSKTGVGTVDLLRDGKLRENWTNDDFVNFGSGWKAVSSTLDNLLFYNGHNGTARLAGIVHLGNLDVFPSKTTLKGFSTGWTTIRQVAHDAMIFYSKETGNAVIGRLTNGNFKTITPAFPLKDGWSHIEPLPGHLFFYDTVQGLAAITPFNGSGILQQGLGDVFDFDKGYSHVVAVENVIGPTNQREHWLLTYDKATGNGAVFSFQNGGLKKTQDYFASFTKGWDTVTVSSGYIFYYRADGTGAVGKIKQGKHETLWPYPGLSKDWTHIVTFYATDQGPG